MMPSQPSIIFIPGGFSLPLFFEPIVTPLRRKGFFAQAVPLQTAGDASDTPLTAFDDADYIASELAKLADQGHDIILIPHSYGGAPATQCLKDLSKAERAAQGKQGGVVRLAYMTAIVPALQGSQHGHILRDVPPREHIAEMRLDDDGWLHQTDAVFAARVTFNDMPQAEGEAWARKAVRHSGACMPFEATHAGFNDVPVSYLLCENDKAFEPPSQRAAIKMIEAETGRKVDVTSIDAGHACFISQTDKVLEWITTLAEKSYEQ